MDNANFSSKGAPGLRQIRKHLDLSQSCVGGMIGVTAEWVRQIESGLVDFSTSILTKLGEVFGCERWELLTSIGGQRLAEIEVSFREWQLAQAKAKAEVA